MTRHFSVTEVLRHQLGRHLQVDSVLVVIDECDLLPEPPLSYGTSSGWSGRMVARGSSCALNAALTPWKAWMVGAPCCQMHW